MRRCSGLVDLCDLSFDNSFVRELPADPLLRNVPRQVRSACYTRVDPTPVRGAAAARPGPTRWAELLGVVAPAIADGPGRRGARRQSRAARHAALRGALRRPPVRPLGGAARRRPRDHARRSRGARTARATSCSSRAPGGRRIRAPPTAARCCAPRCASSCAARRCTTSACRPRARSASWPPASRWCATCSTTAIREAEPGAVVCRVAPSFVRFGNFEILAAHQELDALKRLADYVIADALPGARRAVAGGVRPLVRGDLPPHRRADRRLDARGLRPRRDEHRQHVDPGADHRLRPLRLARGLRSGVDAEHHRRRGPALLLRQPAADRAVEPGAPRRSAAPADRRQGAAGAGTGGVRRDLRARGEPRCWRGKLGLAVARPGRRRRAGERAVRGAAAGRDRHDACSSASWPTCRSDGARTTMRARRAAAPGVLRRGRVRARAARRAGGLAAPLRRARAAGRGAAGRSAASA